MRRAGDVCFAQVFRDGNGKSDTFLDIPFHSAAFTPV
jgi:hypothetical protein